MIVDVFALLRGHNPLHVLLCAQGLFLGWWWLLYIQEPKEK